MEPRSGVAFWEMTEADVVALVDAADAPLPVASAYREAVIENLRVLCAHAATVAVAAAAPDVSESLPEDPFAP
jgi:hypothetical protein